MAELVAWKDVDAFLQWWEDGIHDFDIDFNEHHDPIGYINVKTGKHYTRIELFDWWIKYVK